MVTKITLQRLYNQHIEGPKLQTPAEVVAWLGAVQSQDYTGGKWATGLRTTGITDDAIERAFNDGAILRTHVMRPTWHFVTPEDIRWLLELTAPRIHALNAHYTRQLELDDTLLARSKDTIIKALEGGKHLTRAEVGVALAAVGIDVTNMARLGMIVSHAELEGIVCSGARRGKEHTYGLVDERAPKARRLTRDEALAELTLRYFTSHGPATVKDFVWWSGLTVADAKAGIEMVKSQLTQEDVDDQTYWYGVSARAATDISRTVYLLPNFDEYLVGYTDRNALFDAAHSEHLDSRGNVLFNHTIVMDGRVVGTWKRTFKKEAAVITSTPFIAFSDAENQAFVEAAHRYGEFLDMEVVLS